MIDISLGVRVILISSYEGSVERDEGIGVVRGYWKV